jgi:Fe-S-cluster-containing hydrogenase component 2
LKKVWYNTYEKTIREVKNMAHVITDECVACGACADTCPVGAISLGDNGIYVINDDCVDCGACEDGCPVGAIKAE